MRSKAVSRIFYVLAGILFCNVAHAAADGWYIGLGVGQSQADLESIPVELVEVYTQGVYGQDCATAGFSCSSEVEDTDTAFKLFAGYRVNKYLALEGTLTRFGKWSATASVINGAGTPISIVSTVEVDGFGVVALGFLPLSNTVSLFGKAGVLRWDLESKAVLNDPVAGFSASLGGDKVTGTDPMAGVGAEFTAGRYTRVRVEFEQVKDVGDPDVTGQSDVKLFSLSILSGF